MLEFLGVPEPSCLLRLGGGEGKPGRETRSQWVRHCGTNEPHSSPGPLAMNGAEDPPSSLLYPVIAKASVDQNAYAWHSPRFWGQQKKQNLVLWGKSP